MTENWEFKSRHDLMSEELTPEQGKELVEATVGTISLVIPVKPTGNKAFDIPISIVSKTIAKKAVSKGMAAVVNSASTPQKTENNPALDENTSRISQRKEILADHQVQLEIMKQNKSDYNQSDFENLYKS